MPGDETHSGAAQIRAGTGYAPNPAALNRRSDASPTVGPGDGLRIHGGGNRRSPPNERNRLMLAIAGTGYGLIGILVIILLVVLIVYFMRRA
jgi:hypothetical protein